MPDPGTLNKIKVLESTLAQMVAQADSLEQNRVPGYQQQLHIITGRITDLREELEVEQAKYAQQMLFEEVEPQGPPVPPVDLPPAQPTQVPIPDVFQINQEPPLSPAGTPEAQARVLDEEPSLSEPVIQTPFQPAPTSDPTPQGAAKPVAEPASTDSPSLLGRLEHGVRTASPDTKLQLLQMLGNVATGFAANRDLSKHQDRVDRRQARANLINALSRRQVAQAAPVEARPGRLTSTLAALTKGAGSAREQLERDRVHDFKRDQLNQQRELKEEEVAVRMAQHGLTQAPDGSYKKSPTKLTNKDFGTLYHEAGINNPDKPIDQYIKENAQAWAQTPVHQRPILIQRYENGQNEALLAQGKLDREGKVERAKGLGEVAAHQAWTSMGPVSMTDYHNAHPALKKDYDALPPAAQENYQIGFEKKRGEYTGELTTGPKSLRRLVAGYATEGPYNKAPSFEAAMKLAKNTGALAMWDDLPVAEKVAIEGDFMAARSDWLLKWSNATKGKDKPLTAGDVQTFKRFLKYARSVKEGEVPNMKPFEGWLGNFYRTVSSVVLPESAESRLTPRTFAYERMLNILTGLTARMLSGSRASDLDLRLAKTMIPMRHYGPDAQKLMWNNLEKMADFRGESIMRGQDDFRFEDYVIRGAVDGNTFDFARLGGEMPGQSSGQAPPAEKGEKEEDPLEVDYEILK